MSDRDEPLVDCTLPGCAAKPGEPCVSTVTGELRDEPHLNRLARVRVVPGETYAPTSARLRQVEAERDEIRAAAGRTAERLLYARTELGRVQRALAASQADLTAARDQLAEAKAQLDMRCGSCHPCNAYGAEQDRDQARADLDAARVQIDSDRELIDQLIADRAGLRKRLEQAGAEVLSRQAMCHVTDTDASVSHTQVPECTTDPTEESPDA